MAGDNSEGQEVDVLIKGLSSLPVKPAAAKTAAAAPSVVAAPARPFVPVPVPPLFPPPPRLTASPPPRPAAPAVPSRPIAPAPSRWAFMSAGRLPSLPALAMPRLSLEKLKGLRIPAPSQAVVVRLCVGLGVLLGSAMEFWPYPKTGILWLVFYFFSIGMVLVAGIWSARLTWETRLGYAHTIAVAVVLWGMTLVAEETLRYGYVTTEAASLWP